MADSRWSPAIGAVAFDGVLGSDLEFTAAGPVIKTQSNEDLTLLPHGTGITVVGDAGATSNSLNSNDDLFVAGEVEIDGSIYTDGQLLMDIGGGSAFWLGTTSAEGSQMTTSTLYDHMGLFIGSGHGRVLVVGSRSWSTRNYDNGIQTHPMLAVVADVDPDTDNTLQSRFQWDSWSLAGSKGAFLGIKSITELVTIPVGQGATPVVLSAGNLAPANSRILEAAVYVTQQPGGGATTLDVGITGGNLDGLIDGIAVTTGTDGNSVANNDGVQTFPVENAAATTLTLTTDADVTGTDMIVRVVVWYRDVVAPTS